MKIKREVALGGVCLVAANDAISKAGFGRPSPVIVLHVLPSVRRLGVSATLPRTELGREDVWETAVYLTLSACGLLGIGLGLFY